MARLKLEFSAEWSPEKIRVVSVMLRRELASFGGVANVSDILPIDAEPAAPPALLKFYCTANQFGRGRCTAVWEGAQFSECPAGHGRKWVHKGERPTEPEVAISS